MGVNENMDNKNEKESSMKENAAEKMIYLRTDLKTPMNDEVRFALYQDNIRCNRKKFFSLKLFFHIRFNLIFCL